MLYPTLQPAPQQKTNITAFLGYERNLKSTPGAFYHMENLTSDGFPVLSPRAPRGVLAEPREPLAIVGREKLAWVDGTRLYWDGQAVEGISLSAETPKQLVSMGAYLIIFPDGIYCNTNDFADWGTLGAKQTFPCGGGKLMRYAPCLEDGTEFNGFWLQPTEPQRPSDGDVWVDTSVTPSVFRRYDASAGGWSVIPNIYAKVEFSDILRGFREGDCITLSGCATAVSGMEEQVRSLNRDFTILEILNPRTIRVEGVILNEICIQEAGTVTAERKVPQMDYVTECGNRLWGCKYGTVDGKAVNEIYGSALGDFRNWYKFQGLSTDSYAASRGSDGPWTGACTYQDCAIFFKENRMEKVYPSAVGAHQIVTVSCRGIQPGSFASAAVVNGVLYYKASDGICAYDGSMPVMVSRALGEIPYRNACAFGFRDKYYISMEDPQGVHHLFVYDTGRKLWHREDSTAFMGFAVVEEELFGVDRAGRILSMTGAKGIVTERVPWMAETGILGLDYPGSQVLARLSLRFQLEPGADLDLWAEYDSDGRWEHKAHVNGAGLRSLVIPVLPRRCDHLRLRLQGRGMVRVYGLTLTREEGSDCP